MGSLTATNEGTVLATIARFAKMTDTKEHAAMLEDAGHFMAFTIIPQRFDQGGPDSQGEPWVNNARGGAPLMDHGIMRLANSYEVRGNSVAVGNSRVQARLQNKGGPLAGKQASRRAENKAFSHYLGSNPKAKSGSLGWMYVKKREFIYFGEYALNRILERWRKRWGAAA